MLTHVKKRDGQKTKYDLKKIKDAILRAMRECNCSDTEEADKLAKLVENIIESKYEHQDYPEIENIQDIVEKVLTDNGYKNVAKKYYNYRIERARIRKNKTRLMKLMQEITFNDSNESNLKRDNANIDSNTAMGTMLKYGSAAAKEFYLENFLTRDQRVAFESGEIYIHDFDFFTLTTTCCQINLIELFENGFSTGHGYLREPNSIRSYAALACIAIQSNQNDQHGGQSVPNFDYALTQGVKKTFRSLYSRNLFKSIILLCPGISISLEDIKNFISKHKDKLDLKLDKNYFDLERKFLENFNIKREIILCAQDFSKINSLSETEREVYQAMEAFLHNLNTMHSRAGAQTPFSSINYGTDTSVEGRMVIKNILLATKAGLGHGETPIFPIQIFKVKDGINYNENDVNYDLFKLACEVSAKRLFPNFSFIDAPFNLKYYKFNRPETEVAYMGCRTRVMANVCGPEITYGRGNLSFTSINLPRLAIKSKKNIDLFFDMLEKKLILTSKQLLDRFDIQCERKIKNFPFLLGQGVWMDSRKLKPDQNIKDVLKHGTLSVGFIGLAETLKFILGKHHGESSESQQLGLKIIKFMRIYLDKLTVEKKLNFTLIATPAEGLSGVFIIKDKKKFGIISGVTDKDYYTNSFHVPVYYKITAYEKILIEAPYHELTNAGHITYVELDGNMANNIKAFEKIIRHMKESGIGYGSINHPIDRDPVCGYNGIITDVCPNCGRHETEENKFERIRRITGYLVGTLDRFNDAKRSEEKDRVKHNA
ncbi:MAG: anaerobic ribonucleoside triphosphate reductase [Clostridiales bacterium]|nr:anaerobic ribonucleoside triphosphate reductase [Clostridiales bacterium]